MWLWHAVDHSDWPCTVDSLGRMGIDQRSADVSCGSLTILLGCILFDPDLPKKSTRKGVEFRKRSSSSLLRINIWGLVKTSTIIFWGMNSHIPTLSAPWSRGIEPPGGTRCLGRVQARRHWNAGGTIQDYLASWSQLLTGSWKFCSFSQKSSQCLGCITSDLGLEGMEYLSPKSLAQLLVQVSRLRAKASGRGNGLDPFGFVPQLYGFDLRLCSNFQKDAKHIKKWYW